MLKLKTISVITLLLISCLNLFWHFEKNDIEVDEDYLEIINNNSLPKQDLYSDTRAYRSDEKKSQWMDTFEDNSKVSYKNNMVIENGRAKLRADSGTYRSSGSITSDPISPKGNVKWLTFDTNNTKRPFKRKITIDNTLNSNELINYPINFTIDTSSLIDTGKMRSDCGDIRFYNSNNEKIAYWIKSGINTNKTEIWVNVTSITKSANTEIYLHYGYPNWESQSSGDDTFEYFESFDTPTTGYDPSFWNVGGTNGANVYSRSSTQSYDGTYSLKATFTTTYDYAALTHSYPDPIENKILTIQVYDDTIQNNNIGVADVQIGKIGQFMRIATTDYSGPPRYEYLYYDGTEHRSSIKSRTTGWHEISLVLTESDSNFYLDGAFVASRSITDYDRYKIAYNAAWVTTITHYYDALFVREYTSPEPIISLANELINDEINIAFKILNATDDSILMPVVDGQDISSNIAQEIKIKAIFTSNGWESIELFDWSVDWNTIPSIDNITSMATSINRTENTVIEFDLTDQEELESELSISVAYKSPLDDLWQTAYLTTPIFSVDHWECTFTPPAKAVVGYYAFQFICEDSFQDSDIVLNTNYINVMNNKPSQPEVSILPLEPKTTDELTAVAAIMKDIETPANQLEYWYRWFNNNVSIPELDNVSSIPSSLTTKYEIWRCDVHTYDGEDLGPHGEAEIMISNSPPKLLMNFDSHIMYEDTPAILNNKLTEIFNDADDDELIFSASGQDNINVEINQNNGTLKLTPASNWFGTEVITLFANDSFSYAAEEILMVNVKSINDLPKIIKVGNQYTLDDYSDLSFFVNEDDWLNLTIDINDPDGVADTSKIQCSVNITNQYNFYLDQYTLIFNPHNENVGWHYVKITITDNNEIPKQYIYQNIRIRVININDPPSVEIVKPTEGKEFLTTDDISFSCIVEDSDLLIYNPNEVITYSWFINKIESEELKVLGTSKEFTLNNHTITPGKYNITIMVTDSEGEVAEDIVQITIKRASKEKSIAEQTTESYIFWLSLFIIIIIIIIIISIIVFTQNKRRKLENMGIYEREVLHPEQSYRETSVQFPPQPELIHATLNATEMAATSSQELLSRIAIIPASQQQIQLPGAHQTDQTQGQTQLTIKEKLDLLEERLLKGEINGEIYLDLKSKFEMEAQPYQPQPRLPPAGPSTITSTSTPGSIPGQVLTSTSTTPPTTIPTTTIPTTTIPATTAPTTTTPTTTAPPTTIPTTTTPTTIQTPNQAQTSTPSPIQSPSTTQTQTSTPTPTPVSNTAQIPTSTTTTIPLQTTTPATQVNQTQGQTQTQPQQTDQPKQPQKIEQLEQNQQ